MIDSKTKSAASHMDAVREQAAYWLVEHESSDKAQLAQFEHWLAENPAHRQVFEQMQHMWSAVNPEQQQAKKRAKRRHKTTAALVCLLGVLLQQQLPWQYWRADYNTATGQVNTITLADGSTATLNTRSAINVYYEQGQRRVELVRGEVLLNVRKNNQHSRFVVTSPLANAEALGTRYSVKYTNDSTQVHVYESIVQVTATNNNSVILRAGQQATVSQTGIQQTDLTLPASPDWANQRLRFNQQPLSSVIDRLSEYHPGILLYSNNSTQAERQFTGVLPAHDSKVAIQLLADTMGLTVHQLSPYFVWLEPETKN